MRSTHPSVVGAIKDAGLAKALAEKAENTPWKRRK
jgi:hypothetical protein